MTPAGSVLSRPEVRTWGKYGGLPSRDPNALDELQVTNTSLVSSTTIDAFQSSDVPVPKNTPVWATARAATSSSYQRGVGKVPSAIVCTLNRLVPICVLALTKRVSNVASVLNTTGCWAERGMRYVETLMVNGSESFVVVGLPAPVSS